MALAYRIIPSIDGIDFEMNFIRLYYDRAIILNCLYAEDPAYASRYEASYDSDADIESIEISDRAYAALEAIEESGDSYEDLPDDIKEELYC